MEGYQMRSKLSSLLAAAALIASAGSAAAYDAYVQGPTALRARPSMRSAVIMTLPTNTPVNVMGCRRWCQARVGGTVGYVPAPMVVAAAPAPSGPVGLLAAPLTLPFDAASGLLGGDTYGYDAPATYGYGGATYGYGGGNYGYGGAGYNGAGDPPPVVATY